ncbi:hypothetical protein FRB94_013991 [Tulasnella sp. JGI-2019a]|nr:hypothetical protein FRB94_013991 [Tulasnella sp. JGI-2019a]KAG9028054.1 hypothetical protein FRB95_006886 [Tulasnella sp. JGI-2019a]
MPRHRFDMENTSRRSTPSAEIPFVLPKIPSITLSHKRDTSSSSIDSDSSLSTLLSDQHDGDDVFIFNPDEDEVNCESIPLLDDHRVPHRLRAPSSSLSLRSAVKNVFHSKPSSTQLRHMRWKTPGPLALSKLRHAVKKNRSQGGIVSFKMTRGSYMGCYTLRDTIHCLGTVMPGVQEVELISQIYFLEELALTTPLVARFENLQKLSIFDASDDPPRAPNALRALVAQWAIQCPSLYEVRFSRSSVWRKMVTPGEKDKVANEEWVEVQNLMIE